VVLSLNRGDRGLSLLEVMVATSLLLGSLFATVSAMDSGVKAAAAAERRVKATALAERDLEQLRSLPYHRIGLQRGGPGWTPTFDDATSVAVELPAFDATSVVVDSGVTFTISRHVTWAGIDTQALGPMEGAYKKLTVVVRWPGAGGGSVRLESAVSPYFQADVCSQRSVGAAAQDLSGIVNAYLPGTAPAAAGAESPLSGLTSMLPLVLMFVVLYFVMIRPQMKRQKEAKAMIQALAKGDEVVTAGGMLAKISKLDETYLTVEVASGVEIRIQRTSVIQVLPKGTLK